MRVGDATLREALTVRAGGRQLLETGIEVHALRSRLNLASAGDEFPVVSLPGLGLLAIGQLPWHERSRPLVSTVDGSRVGAWMEDRVQAGPSLSVVPGIRVDYVKSTGETLVAPRFAATRRRPAHPADVRDQVAVLTVAPASRLAPHARG